MADTPLQDEIEQAAKDPAEAQNDGQRVRQHALRDLIEADRYLASKAAAESNHGGLSFRHFKAGGATE